MIFQNFMFSMVYYVFVKEITNIANNFIKMKLTLLVSFTNQ